jgi:hypothetical protein
MPASRRDVDDTLEFLETGRPREGRQTQSLPLTER